jgi:hypothetical protein
MQNYAKHEILFLLVLLFISSIETIRAQDCVDFHKTFCISYEKDGYTTLMESRSFKMAKGDFVNQDVVFNNGHDYHINIAVDDIFGNILFMQIVDIDNQTVLYENSKDNMNLNLEFSALETVNVRITIETPASRTESSFEIEGCIGLLIETRPTPPTGFLK